MISPLFLELAGLCLVTIGLIIWAVVTGTPEAPVPRTPRHAKWTGEGPTRKVANPMFVRPARPAWAEFVTQEDFTLNGLAGHDDHALPDDQG